MQSLVAASRLRYGLVASLSNGIRPNADLSRRGADLSRGPDPSCNLNAAIWSPSWPAPGSTLDIDFVNDRSWIRGSGQGSALQFLRYGRLSNATYMGPDGFLANALYGATPTAYVETTAAASGANRFTYSQDFTNAAWTKSGMTVAASAITPPDGVSSAQRITENSGPITFSSLEPTSVRNTPSTFEVLSVYAKEDPTSAKRYLVIGIYYKDANTRWGWAVIDLATQDFLLFSDLVQTTALGVNITVLNDGWRRVSVTMSSPLANVAPSIGLSTTLNPTNSQNRGGYTGDGTSGMYITGAQFETVVGSAVVGQPRFDWTNTTNLFQPNLFLQTEDMTSSAWTKNAGAVTMSGDECTFIPTATSSTHSISQVLDAGSTRTMTAEVKAAGYSRVVFYESVNNGGQSEVIDLTNGTVVSGSVGSGATVTDLGGGWYRISWTSSFFSQFNSAWHISPVPSSGFNVGNNAFNQAWTADGVSGIIIRRPQIERSSTFSGYSAVGAIVPIGSSFVPTATVGGLLLEVASTNRILWCRDATSGTGTNLIRGSTTSVPFTPTSGTLGTLGSELVTNGDFGSSAGWTVGTGWTISGGVASCNLASGFNNISQNVSVTDGNVYAISIEITSRTSGGIGVFLGASGAVEGTVWSNISAVGVYTMYFVKYTGQPSSILIRAENGFVGSIDNVSVKEVTSNNVTDPNGNSTAAIAAATSANATFLYSASILPAPPVSTPYTFSIWMRRKTGAGNVDITCNSTGTWVTQAITTSWARYSVTQSPSVVTMAPGIRVVTSGDEVEIWGPQFTPGSSLLDYQATTGLPALGWSRSNVTVARDQVGITGIANSATKITATAANGVLVQPIVLASGARCGSVFLKRVSGTGPVQMSTDGTTWSTVSLSSSEWRRFVLTGTVINPAIGIRLATNGDAVAMDYAQVEDNFIQGASSPIFTGASTVTRSPDANAFFMNAADRRVLDITKTTYYAEFDFIFRTNSASGWTIWALGSGANDGFSLAIVNTDGRPNVGFVAPRDNALIPQVGTVYKVAVSTVMGAEGGLTQVNRTAAINGNLTPLGGPWNYTASAVDRMGIGNVQRAPVQTNFGTGRLRRVILGRQFHTQYFLTEVTR